MKFVFIISLSLLVSFNVYAKEKYWACLQAVDEVVYPSGIVTIFYKVTITEKANGQLRANYTKNAKSMMNYSSIDVAFDANENKYFSNPAKPAKSLQELTLKISDIPVEEEVVVSTSADGKKIYSAGILKGFRSYLKAVSLLDGSIVETDELICNENDRKLFTEKIKH